MKLILEEGSKIKYINLDMIPILKTNDMDKNILPKSFIYIPGYLLNVDADTSEAENEDQNERQVILPNTFIEEESKKKNVTFKYNIKDTWCINTNYLKSFSILNSNFNEDAYVKFEILEFNVYSGANGIVKRIFKLTPANLNKLLSQII